MTTQISTTMVANTKWVSGFPGSGREPAGRPAHRIFSPATRIYGPRGADEILEVHFPMRGITSPQTRHNTHTDLSLNT
jgi:hypothetical protein